MAAWLHSRWYFNPHQLEGAGQLRPEVRDPRRPPPFPVDLLLAENLVPVIKPVEKLGERESIFISIIGRSLLVTVFDERSTLGLVKIRTKRGSFDVASILDEAIVDSANYRINQNSFFNEITDEDIDSLFS